MNDSNKYYVPKLEEFYPGFEYERFHDHQYHDGTANTWQKKIYNGLDFVEYNHKKQQFKLSVYEDLVTSDCVRVKFLDQEDIKELGWEYSHDQIFYKDYGKHEKWFYELIFDEERFGIIIVLNNPTTWWHIFQGKLYNKSELKWLMKKIGIS
jgi:hypothetical protein